MASSTLQTSDLIFSEQANHNFSHVLGELKRATLSIHNRLHSIVEDSAFVKQVADAYNRPLVANERCGSWYINPEDKAASAYFKSTDGHTGVWDFSIRRLNLHLIEVTGKNDGCIIVDSTRRGKRMPDALSKTIPIWCCVLNQVIFPDEPRAHILYTPPQVVSESEHAQISARLQGFLQSFRILDVDVQELRKRITKPLRPMWLTPESHVESTEGVFDDYHPVICCTASRRVVGAEISEGGYIQGSGDDTEHWAHGLTPPVFWPNRDLLQSTAEEDLPELIVSLVEKAKENPSVTTIPSPISPTSSLIIAPISALSVKQDPSVYLIRLDPEATASESWQASQNGFALGLGSHKLASKVLRAALPRITTALSERLLSSDVPPISRIIVACSTGRDASVGVALALLCIFYADDGSLTPCDEANIVDKQASIGKIFIKRRLGWIMTALPDVNPSRATLQSVNSFLMKKPF